MSYENTKCPCGSKKPQKTLLCDACVTALCTRREYFDMQDPDLLIDTRRHAQLVILALARKRGGRHVRPEELGPYARMLPSGAAP